MTKIKDAPPKLRPFISLGFDFSEAKIAANLKAYGECPLCGGKDKLFIHTETGQWDCKAGRCQRRGNVYTFIHEWYELHRSEVNNEIYETKWVELANDRQLPPDVLKSSGIVFDGGEWFIPVYNASGVLNNLRRYTRGQGLKGLPEFDVSLFGAEMLADDAHRGERVFICEGEWDVIALRDLLSREGVEGVVIGVPGAGVWKDQWIDPLIGRAVVICYDKDSAGEKGTKRVWSKLRSRVADLKYVQWPEGLPDGFDVRDFVTKDGTWAEFDDLVTEYISDEERHSEVNQSTSPGARLSATSSKRPTFQQVVNSYGQHLHMTTDMVMGLKVIFAVVLTTQIPGDPLWVHIVSPPGTAKTELLMPLSSSSSCYFMSTLTPHSLVSGFSTQGGGDPSVIPKLDKKTLVLKDFTEILNMPRVNKDDIYGTLRGAYDGHVHKPFGNGMIREYNVRFNMVSGVTHSIFGERTASLGERFLLFHLVKGVGFHAGDAIRAAIRNVGKEGNIRQELHDIVRAFVEVEVNPDDLPDMPDWFEDRLIALSSIVAVLRASVERSTQYGATDKLLYRPQHEMGTRLAKQLSKLAYGLALTNNPISLGEDEYQVVSRVALDTCVGFNLEAIAYLADNGATPLATLCERLHIPSSTLRDQLEDMKLLGAVRKDSRENPAGRGAPIAFYDIEDSIRANWHQAGLSKNPEVTSLPEKREVTRVRRVRTKL